MRAPEESWRLSRYTGWTRAQWEVVADETLAAVRKFASARHALIDLPGPVSASGRHSDGLESFARTFLAASFRLVHGGDGGLAQWYAEGIAAGVDPKSPEFISPCNMRYLYQGKDPPTTDSCSLLPWRLGLLTQTNFTC